MTNTTDFTIAEKFLLLAHHPHKERFLLQSQHRTLGLIGSMLFDLSLEGKINVDTGRLIVKAPSTSLSAIHNTILIELSKYKKPRKVKTWISKLSWYGRRNQREVLEMLKRKRIIRIERKRFLFINYSKTKIINPKPRVNLVSEIRDIVFKNKQANSEILIILGLIEACKMHKIVCKNSNETKVCKSKLKDIVKSDKISQGVQSVIKEMQAAILTAVAASTVVTSGR